MGRLDELDIIKLELFSANGNSTAKFGDNDGTGITFTIIKIAN